MEDFLNIINDNPIDKVQVKNNNSDVNAKENFDCPLTNEPYRYDEIYDYTICVKITRQNE